MFLLRHEGGGRRLLICGRKNENGNGERWRKKESQKRSRSDGEGGEERKRKMEKEHGMESECVSQRERERERRGRVGTGARVVRQRHNICARGETNGVRNAFCMQPRVVVVQRAGNRGAPERGSVGGEREDGEREREYRCIRYKI